MAGYPGRLVADIRIFSHHRMEVHAMSKTYEVPAELRADVGKGASRRLRRADKVPAVVYGGSRPPTNLMIEHNFLLHAADDEGFHASILELKVADGRSQQVVLRDLQRHPYKLRILHVDFQRVSDDHELRLAVPLHFVNEATSPAGKKAGVVISHQITELEISALPKDLPEFIEVDLADLKPGERVMLSEIKLPEGVTAPVLEHGDDFDEVVVSAIFAAAEGVEPELADEVSDEEESAADGEGETKSDD
jgi:large subunit ribosomal protein L25